MPRPAAPLLVALTVGLALAGCASASPSTVAADRAPVAEVDRPTAEPTASPSPSQAEPVAPAEPAEAPAPTDAEPPVEDPTPPPAHGEVVAADRIAAASNAGLGWYPLPDGTFIITDPARPLPDVVIADVQRRIDAIGVDSSAGQSPGYTEWMAERAVHADVRMAGKQIATVRLRYMAVPYEDRLPGGYRWVASTSQEGWWMQWDRERDVMVANVDAWVAANTTPGSWIVVVGPGDAVSPSP